MIFPHYQEGDNDPRSIPVRFRQSVAVKKPGKRASDEARAEYKVEKKRHNLSIDTLAMMRDLRARLDRLGGQQRQLLFALDGSFCNQTIFKAPHDRTVLIARCRKDARLCYRAAPGTRQKYDPKVFTPEMVRQDESIPWKRVTIWFGGQRRRIRYKEVRRVLWRRGAGQQLLRSIILAPRPYKLSPHSRVNYREPAYLLATGQSLPIKDLIQAAFDRWQIEVNHREEKSILGVGQSQVWAAASVPRNPTFMVASYSLLHLAALKAFGPGRSEAYLPLPKWRKHARRASFLDIIGVLRKEINETQISAFVNETVAKNLIRAAYT